MGNKRFALTRLSTAFDTATRWSNLESATVSQVSSTPLPAFIVFFAICNLGSRVRPSRPRREQWVPYSCCFSSSSPHPAVEEVAAVLVGMAEAKQQSTKYAVTVTGTSGSLIRSTTVDLLITKW